MLSITVSPLRAVQSREALLVIIIIIIIIIINIIVIIIIIVNEALYYTGVTTLFRDPWGGLALVPLISI